MRIGTWNCRQRLDDKTEWIEELACDVIVVPECQQDSELAGRSDVSALWKGDNRAKGLGVFAFNGWTLTEDTSRPAVPWCLSAALTHPDVDDSLLLLAVWTVKSDGRPTYAGQLSELIDTWEDRLESDSVVIAGDINASFQGPSAAPHSENVERLDVLGVKSAYHLAHDIAPGDEVDMTLRWIGPGRTPYHYHCDYIFVSSPLAGHVTSAVVGSMGEWVDSKRSDHCPVITDLSLPVPANAADI